MSAPNQPKPPVYAEVNKAKKSQAATETPGGFYSISSFGENINDSWLKENIEALIEPRLIVGLDPSNRKQVYDVGEGMAVRFDSNSGNNLNKIVLERKSGQGKGTEYYPINEADRALLIAAVQKILSLEQGKAASGMAAPALPPRGPVYEEPVFADRDQLLRNSLGLKTEAQLRNVVTALAGSGLTNPQASTAAPSQGKGVPRQ